MRSAVGWAPNQRIFYPLVVWWSDDLEHYIAECKECEWESPITRWAILHKCPAVCDAAIGFVRQKGGE